MGAVLVNADAVLFFTVYVAAHMVSSLHHKTAPAPLFRFVGKDAPKQSAADDEVVVLHTFPFPKRTGSLSGIFSACDFFQYWAILPMAAYESVSV